MTYNLNLPALRLIKPIHEEEDQITALTETIDPKPERRCCLFFATRAKKNGRRRIVAHDYPFGSKFVVIFIMRQKWICQHCNSVVHEELPFVDTDHLMTTRLAAAAYKRCYDETFTRVADSIGVTEGTIRNLFKKRSRAEVAGLNIETPRVLGIDEKHLMKAFRCVVGNIERRTLVEMLEDRTMETVGDYFARLPDKHRVEIVCMDMWRPYRQLVNETFPRARIVADKFHVVRYATEAVETIRKQIKSGLDKKDRVKLTHDRWTLLRRRDNWKPGEDGKEGDQDRYDRWETQFPDLWEAYQYKEHIFDLFDADLTPEQAMREYLRWRAMLPAKFEPAFEPLTRAVTNWGGQVFAYFEHRFTSAYIERLNGMVDDLNVAGRGYSFDVLRAKALLKFGKPKVKKPKARRDAGVFDSGYMTLTTDFNLFEVLGIDEPDGTYGADLATLGAAIREGRFWPKAT